MPEWKPRLPAGPLYFAVFALLALAGAFILWPAGAFGMAPAQMSFVLWLRIAFSALLALIGLEFVLSFVILLLTD